MIKIAEKIVIKVMIEQALNYEKLNDLLEFKFRLNFYYMIIHIQYCLIHKIHETGVSHFNGFLVQSYEHLKEKLFN